MNIAALQMSSTNSVDDNLKRIESILNASPVDDIDILVLPENFAFMAKSVSGKLAIQESFGNGQVQNWLSKTSKNYNVCIIAGSFPISSNNLSRPYARCIVYDRKGRPCSHYDKIHLFDVTVSSDESYCESNDNMPGTMPIVFDFEGYKIGLSICYDLRFPELFRYYQQQAVDIIVVPSAFTFETGKAHWDTLLKARAIENLAYLVAPNQTGVHSNGRKTYGHSQIISPWGESLALIEESEGLIYHKVCAETLQKIRKNFPALNHRKL